MFIFFRTRCWAAILLGATVAFAPWPLVGGALAQTGEQKPADQRQTKAAADANKDGDKTVAQFAEAARLLGGPAANPECVWHGRRVVALLWRDDVDTAFRHLDLYDRFGCPGGHIQATFRCMAWQGDPALDPKLVENIRDRVHACWVNPNSYSAAAAAAGAPNTASAPTGQAPAPGTAPR